MAHNIIALLAFLLGSAVAVELGRCTTDAVDECTEEFLQVTSTVENLNNVDHFCDISRSTVQCLSGLLDDCSATMEMDVSTELQNITAEVHELCGEEGQRGVLHCMEDAKSFVEKETYKCVGPVQLLVMKEVMFKRRTEVEIQCMAISYLTKCVKPKIMDRCGPRAGTLLETGVKIQVHNRLSIGPNDQLCHELFGGDRRKRSLRMKPLDAIHDLGFARGMDIAKISL